MRILQVPLLLVVSWLLATATGFAQSVSVGQVGPSFTLDKFGGGTISLDDFSGKIKFIYFFGST